MRKLSVTRTQWAVGNGFFHSGVVSSGDHDLTYVFDCGALQRNQVALRRELLEFRARTERIDVVFISHFDFDHVGSIGDLAHGMNVRRFVIPMTTAAERVLGFVRQLRRNSLAGLTGPRLDFHLRLLAMPVDTLDALRDPDADDPEDGVLVVTPVDDDDLAAAADGVDVVPAGAIRPADVGGAAEGALQVTAGPGSLQIACGGEHVWEWRFSTSKEAQRAAPRFLRELIRTGLITSAAELEDPTVLDRLIREERAGLTACYDTAIHAVGRSYSRNMTSLMLYSGPPSGARTMTYRTRAPFDERPEITAWTPGPAWLGLGDADLRSIARRAHVNAVFHDQKRYVGTFAPSHHGSRRDWHVDLMNGLEYRTKMPVFVLAASGAYGHPHASVVRDINARGGMAVEVNTAQRSRWTEALRVFVAP
ncbi:MBL fold metallo-hydrolase [Clavibacter phaseoli]|uniref:MBL fold metallo-hydrolase n=1 Tax=Clavibacter phaseoli TaxID=1734031 RepID=UPI000E66EA79|nr:MBL fold metallo-hydrolase [Clavibacter phaseoli]RIJ60192.1 MBL fold metallo-hydrolase [Clavibacter phaseoli]